MIARVRFFGISQHVSGMADIAGILAAIDGRHSLDALDLSSHHWVMGRPRDRAPLLDGDGWRRVLDERAWERFYEAWRDRLDPYDAFICFYPPAFALLYRRFRKPILCQIPIRYEYPYHDNAARWSEFTDDLRAGIDEGRIVVCANNPYDAAYAARFLDRPVRFVPSLCEYTAVRWQPSERVLVYYADRRIAELEMDAGHFVHKPRALPRGHAWSDVARQRAIVHFPYNVSTMSIAEQFTMGVPLLFPTLDYAVRLVSEGAPLFRQTSWVSTFKEPPGSVVIPPGGFPHGHDPNAYDDMAATRWWLQYADYYDESSMQGFGYFGSIEELQAIARERPAYYDALHMKMRAFYDTRRQRALDGWRQMIASIT
jgi:hypothetical protein